MELGASDLGPRGLGLYGPEPPLLRVSYPEVPSAWRRGGGGGGGGGRLVAGLRVGRPVGVLPS